MAVEPQTKGPLSSAVAYRSAFAVCNLGAVAHGRNNNLNLIRFFCASAVIFSHSWVLVGSYDFAQRFLLSASLGDIALRSFFFLSGYLILKSGLTGSSAEEFLAARVLRIFPGLMVAVLLCLFVLGPLASTLSIHDYFLNSQTWTFLREMVLNHTQDSLPGVFMQGHLLNAVDGVFWTLPVEWSMYIAVLIVCLATRGKGFWGKSIPLTVVLVAAALALTAQMYPFLDWPRVRSCMLHFVLGSVCYFIRKWIPLSVLAALVLVGLDLLLIGTQGYEMGTRVMPLVLGYFLLTFGFHPAVIVRSFHRFGDYSYGLYVYAFPLQQLAIGYTQRPWAVFAVSYPGALLVAVLSWHYVEHRCLTLRDRLKRTHFGAA